MNNNQKLFCHEYIKNGNNGTRAYMEVYDVDEETARRSASRLLTKDDVRKYIESLQDELKEETIMSAKERMEWLTKVIKGEIEQNAYTTDKLKSIDIMNKMTGEYVTKIEGDIGATIRVDIEDE